MNWKKFVLPPFAIYAIIFLFISSLIGLEINHSQLWVKIVGWVVTIVGFYLAVAYAKPQNISQGFVYGIVWAIILFGLDLLLTIPFVGWNYFVSWQAYLPYAIAIIFPVILPKRQL